MASVTIGRFHNNVIRIGRILRIFHNRLVHISDIAGKYHLADFSVFLCPHFNTGRT